MAIKLLATLLVVVSAYLGWWAISAASFLWLLPAVVSLIAAFGLFLSKHWSQYIWHTMAMAVSLWWAVSVVRIALSGWPYDGVLSSAISLIPGILLVAVCGGGSVMVAKHFRGNKNTP
jgi:hypothetical protein